MDHAAFQRKLQDFYDKELDSKSADEVKAHLLTCVECQEVYFHLKKVGQAFFTKTKPATSDFFVKQVMERIEVFEAEKTPVRRRAAWGWLVPALGLAMLFIMVLQLPPNLYLSVESLINTRQDLSALALSSQALTTDETLEFVIGGNYETTI